MHIGPQFLSWPTPPSASLLILHSSPRAPAAVVPAVRSCTLIDGCASHTNRPVTGLLGRHSPPSSFSLVHLPYDGATHHPIHPHPLCMLKMEPCLAFKWFPLFVALFF